MQKIIFCEPVSYDSPEVNFNSVNKLLNEGWEVKSITPQACSLGGGGQISYTHRVYAGFAVVIEKSEIEI